jgi:hypothetical protein
MKWILIITLAFVCGCETVRVVPADESKDIRYWRD